MPRSWKILMKKTIVDTLIHVGLVIVLGGVIIVVNHYDVRRTNAASAATDTQRRNAICPALMSISRSARDTLIVMKAEPLCNSFVLDNLK